MKLGTASIRLPAADPASSSIRLLLLVAALDFALCFSSAVRAGELVLISDGRADLPIVIPREPAKGSAEADFREAADDLRSVLRKISGATPEMLTLEQWKRRSPDAPAIFMGCAPVEGPPITNGEGSRVQARPDGLFFSVNPKAPVSTQEMAMQQAVNCFAQRALGCRWLMPGELGEVMPKRNTITLPEMTIEQNPVFWSRRLRDQQTQYGGKESRHERALQALQVDGKADSLKEAENNMGAADWLMRMNTGARFNFVFGHNFGGWWDKYGKTHPEYFALQPDGTRTQHPPRERLCESEPGLWNQVAANAIAAFDADPALRMFSICENDGSQRNKFCMCPRCMALDPPHALKFKDAKLYDRKTGGPFADGYPALSDRVFNFFNEVARRVKAKHPDRHLGANAYSIYHTTPVNLKKVEDNLIVSLVSDDPALLEAWSKVAAKLFIRPNTLQDVKTFGMVCNDARRFGRFIQQSARYNVMGHDWPGLYGNWATRGLNYYVVAMMLWDPRQDVEALIEDYLVSAYGRPALPAMRRYFDKLENLTEEVRNSDYYRGRKESPEPLLAHYTAARLDELERCLLEARDATAPDSLQRRRVELNLLGLDYTRRVCRLIADIRDSSDRKRHDTEWRKQAPYFAELAKNPYLGVTRNVAQLTPALRKIGDKK
ncbi:MAG: DUF4838 domain-containing protein [Verrucomicrobia bacterium]|nr:DUF4838 domain-containing protein [Verrucomicrobiota bacterium]